MIKKHSASAKKVGLPPGTLIHVGIKRSENVKVTAYEYNNTDFEELNNPNLAELIGSFSPSKTSWINIDGLHKTELIEELGGHFNLHPLLLEDVLNTGHRPKVEEFDNCIFVTIKMLGINKERTEVLSEQMSIVLGDSWLLSFQEQEGDVFNVIRERLRENKGIIRQKGPDYLLYRLIDTVIDYYFFVLEFIGDRTEILEKSVMDTADKTNLAEIQALKKELMDLRRLVNPLREVISTLLKEDNRLIKKETIRYLRDVYEHTIHINDTLESQRETLANITDLYHTGVNNRMNEVMKVLTIISTIFIPLSFVVGLYGMNFDYIPELHWKYGYLGVWAIFILAVSGMLYFFKRKKWL